MGSDWTGVRACDFAMPRLSVVPKRIAIADADLDMARILAEMARDAGISAITVLPDHMSMARHICFEPCDLLICDWTLQGGNVERFLWLVRRSLTGCRPDLPVVAMNGHVTASLLAAAKGAGVHAVLSKPISPKQFVKKITIAMTGAPLTPPMTNIGSQRRGGTGRTDPIWRAGSKAKGAASRRARSA